MAVTVPIPNLNDICQKTKMDFEELHSFLDLVKYAMEPFSKRIGVVEKGTLRYYSVERRGLGILKTRFGKFWEYSFAIDDQWVRYSAIVKAELDEELLIPVFRNKTQLVLRTDSGCETGQVFGDLTCECSPQLKTAMKLICKVGEGMIINIPHQDGRGMGLPFKLATLWLQQKLRVNTVESAALLAPGGVIDVRTYSGVVGILKFFGIPEACMISLATNNPEKAAIFDENGYKVNEHTPIVIKPTRDTLAHLHAKQKHLGHKGLIKEKE